MFNKQIVALLTAALDTCQAAAKNHNESQMVEHYRRRLMSAARTARQPRKALTHHRHG